MKTFVKRKQIHGSIFIVFLVFLFPIHTSTGLASETNFTHENSSQIINLYFSREMHEAEAHYQRLVILPSNNWDILILKMLVQNFGESLDNVLISVRDNEEIIERTFNTYEQSGLRNSLAYQFEQIQELVVPLNFTNRELLSLSLTVMLDSLISWREPNYNFSIISTSIHCIELVQPGEEIQRLPVMSSSHTYVVQPSQISLFSKKILSRCFIPISIPDGMELNSILNITILGASFDFLSLGFGVNVANGENKAQINTTITSGGLKEQFWEIQLYTLPSFSSNDEFVSITIFLEAQGVLKSLNIDKNESSLSTHPIPGIIMIPILIFILFVIPYYYVYQEELTEKNDQIIEYDKERV
jgi:hypothetical protein